MIYLQEFKKMGNIRYKAPENPIASIYQKHCHGIQGCNPRAQKVLEVHCFEFQARPAYRERKTPSQENPKQPIIKALIK